MANVQAVVVIGNIQEINGKIAEIQKKMNQIKDLECEIRSIFDSIKNKIDINNYSPNSFLT